MCLVHCASWPAAPLHYLLRNVFLPAKKCVMIPWVFAFANAPPCCSFTSPDSVTFSTTKPTCFLITTNITCGKAAKVVITREESLYTGWPAGVTFQDNGNGTALLSGMLNGCPITNPSDSISAYDNRPPDKRRLCHTQFALTLSVVVYHSSGKIICRDAQPFTMFVTNGEPTTSSCPLMPASPTNVQATETVKGNGGLPFRTKNCSAVYTTHVRWKAPISSDVPIVAYQVFESSNKKRPRKIIADVPAVDGELHYKVRFTSRHSLVNKKICIFALDEAGNPSLAACAKVKRK